MTLGVPPPGTVLTSPTMTGVNLYGVLSDGTIGYFGYPDDTTGSDEVPPGAGYVAVEDGNRNACALHASGRIDCWGDNGYGQAEVPAGSWTDVATGDTMTCGRNNAGVVECWGCGGVCPTQYPDIP